jgi:hypothetical protein
MDDDPLDSDDILAAVRALEAADEMLRPQDWPALSDRRLRDQVAQRLQVLGRQLIAVGGEDRGRVEGYLSGWSDAAGAVLADDPGGLQESDLAVLTLIYLNFEILEGILAEEVLPLDKQLDKHEGSTGRDVVKGEELKQSLARLRAHQLIDSKHRPGNALKRLTPAQRRRLADNLILLLRPDSPWAGEIRRGLATSPTREGQP